MNKIVCGNVVINFDHVLLANYIPDLFDPILEIDFDNGKKVGYTSVEADAIWGALRRQIEVAIVEDEKQVEEVLRNG